MTTFYKSIDIHENENHADRKQSVNVVVRGKQSGDNKYNAMPRPVIFKKQQSFRKAKCNKKYGPLIRSLLNAEIKRHRNCPYSKHIYH